VRQLIESGAPEYLDLEPYFVEWRQRNPGRPLLFRLDLHWSVEGNQLVADALVRALADGAAEGSPGSP
jgi:hypothetical protein